jgi:hypothetical protein
VAAIAPPRGATPNENDGHVTATDTDAESRPRRGAWQLRSPSLDTLFTAVFAVFGWGVGIERLSDNSFFWHLRTGGLILDSGIPHADPYSYTAEGTRWVAQSWLAEVIYAGIDRAVGPFGIRVFGGLVGVAIAVLAFRLALRLARDRVRAALLTVAALAALYTLWSERPLLLGVLFFVVLLWVVEVPDSLVGRHPWVSLPILFWCWANVHGTFALGFAYLGLHLLGRWLEGHRPWTAGTRERTLVIGSMIAFAACFVNPYGVSLVTFPVDLLRRGEALKGVIEWSSPDFHSVRGLAFALWVAVFVVVLAKARHRVGIRDLVVTVPFLLLGFWALRNVAIAPLVCLPVAARAVARDQRSEREPTLRLGWVFAGALAFVALAMGMRASGRADYALDSYPVKAMNAVEEQGLLGTRVLTDDADAGYVILRYGPDQQQVFMDDRFDMFPLPVIRDFTTVNGGSPGWDRVLDEHDVEVVVWGRDRVLSQLLRQSDDWTITHRDADYLVFVRR